MVAYYYRLVSLRLHNIAESVYYTRSVFGFRAARVCVAAGAADGAMTREREKWEEGFFWEAANHPVTAPPHHATH